ncbi:hypothetical protein COJ21_26520 [Priestia megaterium]|uniref:hypothetical protein n=1 Tax=Priestia megaterium TaxID=1404 RepID=UPI000BF8B887|nr:hypothetical protein [Priestia megaterium]PFK63480.1 hypothetical protein COJ21_26520 [Priestia megaterium]
MSKLKEVVSISEALLPKLEFFQEKIVDLNGISATNDLSTEEEYQLELLYKISFYLEDVKLFIEDINKPVKYQGRLEKNLNGRYEVQGKELCTGTSIELWIEDEASDGKGKFVSTLLLHSAKNYYIRALGRGVKIDGMLVRVR